VVKIKKTTKLSQVYFLLFNSKGIDKITCPFQALSQLYLNVMSWLFLKNIFWYDWK